MPAPPLSPTFASSGRVLNTCSLRNKNCRKLSISLVGEEVVRCRILLFDRHEHCIRCVRHMVACESMTSKMFCVGGLVFFFPAIWNLKILTSLCTGDIWRSLEYFRKWSLFIGSESEDDVLAQQDQEDSEASSGNAEIAAELSDGSTSEQVGGLATCANDGWAASFRVYDSKTVSLKDPALCHYRRMMMMAKRGTKATPGRMLQAAKLNNQ